MSDQDQTNDESTVEQPAVDAQAILQYLSQIERDVAQVIENSSREIELSD